MKYHKNWQKILREYYRIVKKNGILVFEMPNKISVNKFSRDSIAIFPSSEKELRFVLKQTGFRVFEIKGGPVLPGLLYDLTTNKAFAKIMKKAEDIIKLLLGNVLLSRFIYISCAKV